MKTIILFLAVVANVSAVELAQMWPSSRPTSTQDPWQCITEDLPQYFKFPKPTGTLLSAILSYGDELRKTCTNNDPIMCPRPDKTRWCGFSTAAQPTVLTEYSSYGKAVSSWWSSHSSKALFLATDCPNGWYEASTDHPANQGWLNQTIIFAECYAQANPSGGLFTTSGFSATGTNVPPRAGVTADTSQPMKTNMANGFFGKGENMEKWMVAGSGMAYAAMNEVW